MFQTVATELPRLLACNGSRLLGGSSPPSNDDPAARDEGIAAHWLITKRFEDGGATPETMIGQKAPNGVTITNSIFAAVSGYLDLIETTSGSNYYSGIESECEVIGRNWAVACRTDFWTISENTITIADYKHGFRIVEPDENWTMIAYAIAVYNMAQQWGIYPQNVEIIIYQPRVPHPAGVKRVWRLTVAELINRYQRLDWCLNNLNDMLNSGPQCHRCANAISCPALRTATFNAVDVSTTAHAEQISNEAISAELTILDAAEKRLKSRKKQLEDLALYRLKEGAIIDNYAAERSYGNSTFNEGFTGDFLTAILGVDCVRKDTITPTQAIKAGASKQLVEQFSSRKETGLKLTRVTADQRAKRMFGKG